MKRLTRFELASKSTPELHALRRELLLAFARAGRGTPEYRDALASLAALDAEIASRPAL